MKIVHVVRSLIINSGVSVFAGRMASAMAKADETVSLRYTWLPELPVDESVDLKAFNSLDELEFRPDVVHVHALWSMDMVKAMNWCRRNGVRYFVSPHGGLMPRVLNTGWLKKHLFYWLFLRKNLNGAAGIHCTGDGEVAAVKKLGIKARTFVVPLGCDLPDMNVSCKKENMVLFLSRLGEEKGLLYLLEAWKAIEHRGWRLILAGPDWEGFRSKLEDKIRSDQICDVSFFGQANEMQKSELYCKARLFVLPSPVENFSMVVLDALAFGIPVICTKGTPWSEIQENGCGWWIEPASVSALKIALNAALGKSESELAEMGRRGTKIAKKYSWDELARKLISIYSGAM